MDVLFAILICLHIKEKLTEYLSYIDVHYYYFLLNLHVARVATIVKMLLQVIYYSNWMPCYNLKHLDKCYMYKRKEKKNKKKKTREQIIDDPW